MIKTPLTLVNERFGSKEKLVEAIEQLTTQELWIDRTSKDKGLARVSNAKLIRLHSVLSEVKQRFGNRAGLIRAILELERRTGDQGLKTRLESHPTPRLLDCFRAKSRRAAQTEKAGAKPSAGVPRKRAHSRKAQAKARAAKP
jgi:hypothetical protein